MKLTQLSKTLFSTTLTLAAATMISGQAAAHCGACAADKAKANHAHNIPETAAAAGNFNTLLTAVKAAGLAETLSGEGPFTVLAPTDDAFAKLPKGTVEALLKDTDKLKAILLYHVVPAKLDAE